MNTEPYLQIPYRDKGRSWQGGDCWFLCYTIYARELGIILPRYDSVSLHTTGNEALGDFIETETRRFIRVDNPRAFDLVLCYQGRHATHIGCAIDGREMIHLREGVGVAIEPVAKWDVYGFFRHEAMT